MTFGDRLKAARDSAGLSQRELAEKAGITRDAVSSLEQGRRSPNWDTVQALAGALGVSCESFKAGAEAPQSAPATDGPAEKATKKKGGGK